jgi:hypothetical protein
MFQTIELGVQVVPFLAYFTLGKGSLEYFTTMVSDRRENALILDTV